MFKRLVFENWVVLFPLTAFVTALSIYLSITWGALKMRRSQSDRLAHLPLND